MQSDKLGDFKYKTMLQCFSEQYKTGGAGVFFKGYVICMMRSFPVNAAAITVYRFMQNITGTASNWCLCDESYLIIFLIWNNRN